MNPQRANVVAALKSTRPIKPGENNWLLFSALVEAALWQFTGECEIARIEYALNKHEQWYVGDGTYGDGPNYHWDYYNSFVIQPALIAVLEVCREKKSPLATQLPTVLGRAKRYAEVQERLISPEGTFPVIGRSSAYRFGAFQTLSLMALRRELPKSIEPAAVRCGLAAVVRRMIDAPGTFDTEAGCASASPAISPPSGNPTFPPAASICASPVCFISGCRRTIRSGHPRRRTGPRNGSGRVKTSRRITP